MEVKNKGIILPDECEYLRLDNMRNIEGGGFQVKMTKEFLNKNHCKKFKSLIQRKCAYWLQLFKSIIHISKE